MKKVLLVLGVILLMSVSLISCSPGGNSPSSASQNELKICGKYVLEGSPKYYIIIREDWMYMKVRPSKFEEELRAVEMGQWGLGDNVLILIPFYSGRGGFECYEYGGEYRGEEWKVEGNKLIDNYGGTWVKQ